MRYLRPLQLYLWVSVLVFALHMQAFLLLAVLLQSPLPAVVANALSWWTIAYYFLALRRVYACSWSGTVLRGVAALAGYFAVYYLANLLLVFGIVSF